MAIYRQTNEDTIFYIFYDLGNLDVRYNIDTLSNRVDSFINQGIELEWVIDHDNFCIFVNVYFWVVIFTQVREVMKHLARCAGRGWRLRRIIEIKNLFLGAAFAVVLVGFAPDDVVLIVFQTITSFVSFFSALFFTFLLVIVSSGIGCWSFETILLKRGSILIDGTVRGDWVKLSGPSFAVSPAVSSAVPPSVSFVFKNLLCVVGEQERTGRNFGLRPCAGFRIFLLESMYAT